MDNTQQPGGGQNPDPQRGSSYEAAARPSRRGLYTVVAVLVLLTAAAFIVRSDLFRVWKKAEVIGLVDYDADWVLSLAGISEETTYFGVSEKKIAAGIARDRYLVYHDYEKIWPDRLTLWVTERVPRVNFIYHGVQYVLAGDGMVLESSTALNLANGCVKLTLSGVRDVRVGEKVMFQSDEQLRAMQSLLEELELQGVLGKLSELNLYDLDNIYLVTLDGYTANIGRAEELRAKIGTVRAVVAELRRRGLWGGIIEATVPGQASYRSPD